MTDIIIDTETTGLDPMQDELIAIGAVIDGKQSIFIRTQEEPEIEIIEQFWELVSIQHDPVLIGFNLDFDWQFLKLRSLLNRVKFRHFRDYVERKDIRIILNPERYKKGTALTDYCTFLGIPDGDECDGSMMPQFWREGNTSQIGQHLAHDLMKTSELWKLVKTYMG